MKVNHYIKILSEIDKSERLDFIESLEIKNYGSSELTETEMWILTNASKNEEYLHGKLKEADELSLDTEAPEEVSISADVDLGSEATPAEGGDELSLDTPTEGGDELSLDTPAEGGDELSLDTPAEGGDELSLDTPAEGGDKTPVEPVENEQKEIETSKEGIGILPLLGEIQEKLANGKPSEVELAALKAIKKLVG